MALASCTQPRLSLPPVESLPNPPMAAQPGVTPGSSRDSRTRRHDTQSSAVPRTAVAGNCLLLPLCESQQRFVHQGAFCYCNQQLREERGRVGRGRDDDRGGGEGGGGGRDGDVVGEEKR